MIKTLFCLLLLPALVLMLIGCETKDSDDTYPEIIISQPVAGNVYANGDTISLKAVFSDDKQLSGIEINLLDKENKPVLSTLAIIPNQNPFSFQGSYIIDDPLLPGGEYQLRFRSSDGINVVNQFIKVQVKELERKLLYPVIITHPEKETWQAYRLTNGRNWLPICTFNGDYCGSTVNSAASQLYMCGAYNSDLIAYRLSDGIPLWNCKPKFNSSYRWFEGIKYTYPYLYISCAEGNIRGYDKSGNEMYKSETYAYAIPSISVTTKNYVIGSFTDAFSSNKFIITFHNTAGGIIYTKFIQAEVINMQYVTNDKVLVFTNTKGQGGIYLFNGADNTFVQLHPFYDGTFFDAESVDTDNFIISTSAGLYWYKLSNNSLSLLVSKNNNNYLAFDNTTQLIFACSGKKMEVFTFPFATLEENYTLPDTAVDLHLLFNK